MDGPVTAPTCQKRRPGDEYRRTVVVRPIRVGRGTPLGGARADYLDALTEQEAATMAGLLEKIIACPEDPLGTDANAEWGPRFAEARRHMGEDMGEERFVAMLRMREHGFGLGFGPGGPGFGPSADDGAYRDEGLGGRSRHGGRGGCRSPDGLGRSDGRGGRGRADHEGSGFPEEFPERGAWEFRPGRARRNPGHQGRGHAAHGAQPLMRVVDTIGGAKHTERRH